LTKQLLRLSDYFR